MISLIPDGLTTTLACIEQFASLWTHVHDGEAEEFGDAGIIPESNNGTLKAVQGLEGNSASLPLT